MEKLKSNISEIKNEAQQILRLSISKQEAFETLSKKHKNSLVVAGVIRNFPSAEAIKKYGKWNYLLLGLLIISTVLFMLAGPSIGILIWYGLLIYSVAKVLVEYYIWVSVLATCGIIGLIAMLTLNNNEAVNFTILIIAFFIMIIYFILPIWIRNRLCPKPTERKEKYLNTDGEPRLRIIYEFKDFE